MKKVPVKLSTVITVCVLAAAVLALYSGICALFANIDIRSAPDSIPTEDYSYDWVNGKGELIDIKELSGSQPEMSVSEPFVLTKKLENTMDGMGLFIHARDLVVNVYVGGEPVWVTAGSGTVEGLSGFDSYILADIPAGSEGKEVRLEIFRTGYTYGSRIDRVNFGLSRHITLGILSEGIFPVSIGEFLLIMGVTFTLLGAFTRKRLDSWLRNLYFGILLIFMAVCVMLDTAWAHILIGNIMFAEKLYRFSMAAALTAFLAFTDSSFETEHEYLLKVLTIASAVSVPVFSVLDAVGIIPVASIGLWQHIFMTVCGIAAGAEAALFSVKTRGLKLSRSRVDYIALYIFLVFTALDILMYYCWTGVNDSMLLTRLGMLFLTGVTIYDSFVEVIEMIKLGVQAGRIGKIAFTDANTGINNAAAFRAKFDELESNRELYKFICIVQFDVNNLKVINDTKGHEAGDLLIKTAAGIIDRSFGTVGTCYRTGGDEFVALITSDDAPIVAEDALYKFNKLIDNFNKDEKRPFDLRIAHGIAYYQNDKTRSKSLKEIHKLADERMYTDKKMLKARYAKTAEEAVVR